MTKDIYALRREALINQLKAMPSEEYCHGTWEDATECGTVRCAGGTACVMKDDVLGFGSKLRFHCGGPSYFPDKEEEKELIEKTAAMGFDFSWTGERFCGYAALALFFGMDRYQTYACFHSSGYHSGWAVTREEVIKKLEKTHKLILDKSS